jgi:hypothetical protein
MIDHIFDRLVPTDWVHVERYGFAAAWPTEVDYVEKVLDVPRQYRDPYDQGREGACVGFSQSWLMSILNRKLYDARWLYLQAQLIDEYPTTPPAGGTSLRAGFDILRIKGHRRIYAKESRPPELEQGISANRWATTVDEIRRAISLDIPVNLGINWYRQFSSPEQRPRLDDNGKELTEFGIRRYDWWIGVNTWGRISGGHAITCIGASDRRDALALCNTWGESYPFIVWLPYVSMERLLREEGEAGIVVDRV